MRVEKSVKCLQLHPYRRHDGTPTPFLANAAKCPDLRPYFKFGTVL
jgi:hypothetical protein